MRKENRTAKFLSYPLSSPAEMVLPDREIPGKVPKACAQPTRRASVIVAVLAVFLPRAIRSEKKRMKPVAINATDTKVTLFMALSI